MQGVNVCAMPVRDYMMHVNGCAVVSAVCALFHGDTRTCVTHVYFT